MSKYKFGNMEFKTLKAVKAYGKQIIKNTKLDEKLTNQDHIAFLKDVIKRHPEYTLLRDKEIDYFFVSVNGLKDYPSICFWIRKLNGEERHFSINKCINNSIYHYNMSKLRLLISDQITKFKKTIVLKNDMFLSAISGKLYPAENMHIDHKNTRFTEIVNRFFIRENINIRDIILTYNNPGDYIPKAKDEYREVIEQFKDYHSKFELQAVTIEENLKKH